MSEVSTILSGDTKSQNVQPVIRTSIEEKVAPSESGFLGVIALLVAIIAPIFALIQFFGMIADEANFGQHLLLTILGVLVAITAATSVLIQTPGQATVLEFFGDYKGTVRKTGIIATLPFMKRMRMSVKIANFETPVSKVNDIDGNPINISSIVVWQLQDTAKATYGVENYHAYLQTQAEAAVRHVASQFKYDAGIDDDDNTQLSLLKNADEVNEQLAREVAERAGAAGIDIIEVRINNLSYSVEIAQAMLQRQQAAAILAARKIIVKGAVEIVEDAAKQLNLKGEINQEQQGELIKNLLVVLVSESRVTPTINAG